MALGPNEVDSEDRKRVGRDAALAAHERGEVVEEKSVGQTSPDVYPFTYWYKVGWNEAAAELASA
jgi:hypothetical protein